MIIQVITIGIYLSFLLDFIVWPIPSEASTFALIKKVNISITVQKVFLFFVFILSLVFYLTPLALSIIYLTDGTEIEITFSTVIGIFLSIIGRIISTLASNRLRNQTEGIASDSLFKYSRNPISLGLHCTILGLMIVFGKWYLWLGLVFYLINIHFKIKIEESFLQERYGTIYEKYKNSTPRYFLKI